MEPITVLLIAGAAALFSGGGTAIYKDNEHQKSVAQLQDQIARLQKTVLAMQQQLAKKQRSIADLQAKLADREAAIGRHLKDQMDITACIVKLDARIERNNGLWAKVVAALQFKLGQLAKETEELRQQLSEAEARAVQTSESILALEAERGRLEARAEKATSKVESLEREIQGFIAQRSAREKELQAVAG